MKHRYFNSFLSLLLIFGLCSCKSDESTNVQEDGFAVKSVDYVHENKSSHNINDTKELAINSSIDLSINRTSESFSVTGESQCFGASLEKPAYNNQFWTNQTSIPVKELLPLEVFIPLKRAENQILCHFQLTIKNELGSKTTIDLKDIKIINLFGFYEMNLLESKTSEPEFYILENELSRDLYLKHSIGKIHLICDGNTRSMDLESSTFPLEYLKKFSWLEKDWNFCRFVVEDPYGKNRFIGKTFYIQKQNPQLEVYFSEYLPEITNDDTSLEFQTSKHPVAEIMLHNPGDAPLFVDLSSLKDSRLDILGYYSKGPKSHMSVYGKPIALKIHWSLKNGQWVQQGNKKYIQIKANSSAFIEGFSEKDFSCPLGSAGANFNPTAGNCYHEYFYHGYLARFFNLPLVKLNKYLSLEKMDWTNYQVMGTNPAVIGNFNYWQGDARFPSNCTSVASRSDDFPAGNENGFSNLAQHQCKTN